MNLDQSALDVDALREHTPAARPLEAPPREVLQSDPSLEVPWNWSGIRDQGTEASAADPGWLGEVMEMVASAYTPIGFSGSSHMERLEELFFRGLVGAGALVLSYWVASTYLAPGLFS